MAKGSVSKGWSLVWRHQKILWWVFAINILTAYVSTLVPRMLLSGILDHSLESQKLANGFHFLVFAELLSKPELPMTALVRGSMLMAWVFFFFMLFITGGILVAYREDRRLSTGEFFESSGQYFWRMVRLVLMSLVPFGAVALIVFGVSGVGGTLNSESANAKLGIYVMLAGYAVCAVLVLIVRLWFDVAQVRAVAQNERAMFRNLMRSFTITFKALPKLFSIYFRISLMGWAVLALGMYGWTRLTGNHVFRVFILWEIVLLAQLFARLWQRASSVSWYGEFAEANPAVAVEFTTLKPVEISEPVAPEAVTPGPGTPGTPAVTP